MSSHILAISNSGPKRPGTQLLLKSEPDTPQALGGKKRKRSVTDDDKPRRVEDFITLGRPQSEERTLQLANLRLEHRTRLAQGLDSFIVTPAGEDPESETFGEWFLARKQGISYLRAALGSGPDQETNAKMTQARAAWVANEERQNNATLAKQKLAQERAQVRAAAGASAVVEARERLEKVVTVLLEEQKLEDWEIGDRPRLAECDGCKLPVLALDKNSKHLCKPVDDPDSKKTVKYTITFDEKPTSPIRNTSPMLYPHHLLSNDAFISLVGQKKIDKLGLLQKPANDIILRSKHAETFEGALDEDLGPVFHNKSTTEAHLLQMAIDRLLHHPVNNDEDVPPNLAGPNARDYFSATRCKVHLSLSGNTPIVISTCTHDCGFVAASDKLQIPHTCSVAGRKLNANGDYHRIEVKRFLHPGIPIGLKRALWFREQSLSQDLAKGGLLGWVATKPAITSVKGSNKGRKAKA